MEKIIKAAVFSDLSVGDTFVWDNDPTTIYFKCDEVAGKNAVRMDGPLAGVHDTFTPEMNVSPRVCDLIVLE
jgi:hypothetical protein